MLRLGTLPFTSSGKIQRMECRTRYQAGDFDRL
jgi:acyl-CoA synthetase (AMP-forming)/AMP-acid ligase II